MRTGPLSVMSGSHPARPCSPWKKKMNGTPRALRRALATAALVMAAGQASAHVHLISPDGGEMLQVGSVFEIRWEVVISHPAINWDVWYSTTGMSGPWIPVVMDLPPGSTVVGAIHTYDWTIPNTPSDMVRVRVRMDNPSTDYYDISDADLSIVSPCAQSNFCPVVANSFGFGALIGSSGSQSVAANNFTLEVTGSVPGQPGIFFFGPSQIQVPFGNGFLCIGAPQLRLLPPVVADALGMTSTPVDFSVAPGDSITGASTWYFQHWYRDPAAGGAAFNLSNGLEVTFCP